MASASLYLNREVGLPLRLCLVAAVLLVGCQDGDLENHPHGPGPGTTPSPAGPEIVDVAAGYQHTCALRSNGTVRCWGANAWGQLGSGPSTGLVEPRDVPGLDSVIEVSSQGNNTCGLLGDGTVHCWGANDIGQLGQQNTAPYLSPVVVEGLTDVIQVEVGGGTSCGLRGDGTVWCWGGQGRDDNDWPYYDLSGAAPVVDATDLIQISLAGQHGCGVRSDTTVWCWNEHNEPRRVAFMHPDLEGVQQVAARGRDSYVIFDDQTIARIDIYDPITPENLDMMEPRRFEQPDQIVDLCGEGMTCLLRADGTVRCSGSNSSGQAGDGTMDYAGLDSEVWGVTDAVALGCGSYHNCAVHRTGAVSCWGRNDTGALGVAGSTDSPWPLWVTNW